MRLPSGIVAAAAVAAVIPLYAAPSAATPLSQTQALGTSHMSTSDIGAVDQVQYRRYGSRGDGYYRYGHRRYYGDGYYAYGAAPIRRGYYNHWGFQPQAPSPGSSWRCTADRELNNSFPSWMCR